MPFSGCSMMQCRVSLAIHLLPAACGGDSSAVTAQLQAGPADYVGAYLWLFDAWFLVGEIGECFSDSDGELHLMTYHARNPLPFVQWEFQDPKMEVLWLHHIKPYFGCISPYIGLIYGRYLRFRYLKWPLIRWRLICMYDMYAVDFYCMLRYQPCNWEAELNPWSQAHGRKVSPKCAPGEASAAEGRFQNQLAKLGRTTQDNHDIPWLHVIMS